METQQSQQVPTALSQPVPASTQSDVDMKDEGTKVPPASDSVDAGKNGNSVAENGKNGEKHVSPAADTTGAESVTQTPAENSANVPVSVSKEGDDDEDGDGDDDADVEEGAEEEDALFTSLERDQEKEDEAHAQDEQPKDVAAAPKLLQKAFEKGDVKLEDSESEEEPPKKKVATQEEEKKGEETGNQAPTSPVHRHARVSCH